MIPSSLFGQMLSPVGPETRRAIALDNWGYLNRSQHDDARLLLAGWPVVVRKIYQTSHLDGSRSELVLGPYPSFDEAAGADAEAAKLGWKEPRWWQFWRWDDLPRRLDATMQRGATT